MKMHGTGITIGVVLALAVSLLIIPTVEAKRLRGERASAGWRSAAPGRSGPTWI
jgi:hypothetical protein